MKVAVVGAGVVGLFAAYYVGREGSRVTVFDPEPPGERSVHAAGILEPTRAYRTNTFAFLRRVVRYWRRGTCTFRGVDPRWLAESARAMGRAARPGSDQVLASMAERSDRAYRAFAAERNDFSLRTEGLLETYRDPAHFAAEREAALAHRDRVPVEVRPSDGGGGSLFFPTLAWLHTERFVARILRELANTTFVRRKVERVGSDGSLAYGSETAKFDRVVVCTGVAARALGLPLTGVRGFGWHVKSPTPPACATILTDEGVALSPFADDVKAPGGWDFDLSSRTNHAASILRAVAAAIPLGEVVSFNHGSRPCTPDGLPVAGRRDDLVVANGGFRLGWSFAPSLGEEAARLALGESDNDPFLARFLGGLRPGTIG